MMDHTPIEALFHHKANCTCESCNRVVKPFRSGTFVSNEDIEKMNKSIQELIQENSRIQTALNQVTEQKNALEQYATQLANALQARTTEPSQPVKNQQAENDEDSSDDEEEEDEEQDEQEEKQVKKTKANKNSRDLIITIDTSKLIYIAIIAVIVIMVLKR